MDKQEQELVSEVQKLFYNCQLNQCINVVNKLDIDRSFNCHKIMQYYRGLSLFENQETQKGYECFESVIDENQKQNQGKVNEVDVMIRVMYQLEMYYTNVQHAEKLNFNLEKVFQDYEAQHSSLPNYKKEIYLFGKGMFLFIENSREQNYIECTKLVEEAIELTQEYKQEMMIALGWMYYIYQKTDLSCKVHQQLYLINPRYPSLANNFAISLHEIGKNGKAEELFLEEEKLRNNNQISIQNIAQFYFSLENIHKEREYYEKLFSIVPKTARIYHKYGQYLIRIGQKEKGLSLLMQGLQIDPQYCPIYQDLSDIEYDNKNYVKAKEYIEKCIYQYPKDGYYMYRFAACLEALEKYQEAIEAYKQAIIQKNYLPYKIFSNAKLGMLHFKLNQHLKTLEEFLNTCNYKSVQSYQQKGNIIQACFFLNQQSKISLKDKLQQINKQNGYIVTRFEQFSIHVGDKNLSKLFLYRLDNLRAVLAIIAYQKYIESELIFQSQILHWDLFLN
ncbi:tetratricopeptide repeat protein (macronuclear) [Tetrahymena thermophila SB210]|uniref:Tetratricopeptide repeat protein n=1 Tax=Tetrahymena thermophila (strain SB210) TaxID=312017 RepID=Q22KN9_TETTS|nr:tetratricopeptide repeat protein [Tetrahymena thermophila SB210]EAR85760.1 tetratricopeptide repeat protein [Tetrahymena thermophila SB210]|eukprot:XP_001033423.1 tetratricopeptide repeat protein [Tetrahymena thermophila SB210]